MNYQVSFTEEFANDLKKLVRKYPSLKSELDTLMNELSLNPTLGQSLGNNTYKIRLAVKSKGRGKSGGLRVISYIITFKELVFLIAIYDKSDMGNISDNIIKAKTIRIDKFLI